MRARNPVHNLRFADHNTQRHAGCDALRTANDIGLNAGVFDRPPFPGAANATLDFIHHKENAVAVADASQLLHENIRRDDISALTLHRLDEDSRNFLRSEDGLEQLVFDEPRTAEREGFAVLRSTFAAA